MRIHKNPSITYMVLFGPIELKSPYLWPGEAPSKPLVDEMKITHRGRSDTVKRAFSDFGIDESFSAARQKFKEHYHCDVGISTVDRTTKEIAQEASDYLAKKLSFREQLGDDAQSAPETILVELDGCEIRTAKMEVIDSSSQTTPRYNNPKKEKTIQWRDVRIGFARPLAQKEKIFIGKMDAYPGVVTQLYRAAESIGMTADTPVIGVADGGIGLREELVRQFPTMQCILDKSHLRDHFYETADKMGISKTEHATWVESRIEDISQGHVAHILEELTREHEKTPCDRLRRLIGYVTRFEDAVSYKSFKEKEYPIGSGEVESAHKSIPQKRLKIPGATWHADSINPMLMLRIVRANDWWEDFWEQREQRLAA